MKKKLIGICTIVLVLALGLNLPILASSLGGELSTAVVYDWDADEKTLTQAAIPSNFRLSLEDDLDGGGKVYFSLKGLWDWKNKEGSLAADELWFGGYTAAVDYTLGRQVISWGTADGFNPTNYFARLDSSALTSGDFGGEPFWAGQATYYAKDWSVTGVVIPFFKAQKIDSLMKEMMLEVDPQAGFILDAIATTKKPDSIGKDFEAALRAETFIKGFDVQASIFTGFEPLPGIRTKFDPTAAPLPIKFEGEYRRQHFVGLATAGTIGDVGVWGEAAYGGPTPFAESENPLEMVLAVNERYLQAVLGADYTFALGKGLLVQGQYIYRGQGSLFAPYGQDLKPAHYLYGRLSYDLSQDGSLELVAIHGLADHSGLLLPSYTHRFPHSLTLEAGLVAAYGGDDKEFSPIPAQARVGVSYKF
ncbi:MAG TPA: hypothetical protein GX528_09240 [Firmicutes bacterium]|nr:hypothetical protein [Bacillota bacterium]